MAALVDLGRFRKGRFAEGRFSGFGGPPGAITNPVILITSRTNLQTAPDFVSFALDPASLTDFVVTPSGNGRVAHADLDVSWDFGEGIPYAYNDRVQPLGRNSRYARGYIAAHVFRTHGTHTVTVTVRQRQNGQIVTRTGTLDVTVADPEVTFAGARTVYLAPDGDFSNKPAGAQEVQTLPEAFDGFFPPMGGTDDPRRLMIKENATVVVGQIITYHTRFITRMTNTHIVAENGGRATIQLSTFNWEYRNDGSDYDQDQLHDVVFQGIDFVGGYSAITQTGPIGTRWFQSNALKNVNEVFADCTMSGLQGRILGSKDPEGNIFALDNCDITNMSGFIHRPTLNKVVFTGGVRMRRNQLAMSERLNNDNGGLRTGKVKYEIHWGDDCFANVGYSPFSNNNFSAIQPCYRLASAPSSVDPQIYMGACHVEGGFQGVIQMVQVSPDSPTTESTAVIEQCYILGCWQTVSAVHANRASLTLRSCIISLPQSPEPINMVGVVNYSTVDGSGAAEAEPIRAYSNTVISENLDGAAQPMITVSLGVYTNLQEANNVVFTPNFDPNSDQVDLAVTRGFDPLYAGYTDTTGTLDATKATPTGTVYSGVLAAGSTAIGDADTSALMAVTNWSGDLIVSATPDRGALAT